MSDIYIPLRQIRQYIGLSLLVLKRFGLFKSIVVVIKFILTRTQFSLRMSKLFFSPPNYYLFMTKRCNLSCGFCHYNGELEKKDATGTEEFQLSDLIDFEKTGVISRYSKVCLYGGEPMLNQSFFDVTRYLNQNGYLSSTITNGAYLDKYIEKLEAIPPHFVTVSYYDGIINSKEAYIKRLSQKSIINISFIITEKNVNKIQDVIEFSIRSGAHIITMENLIDKKDYAFKSIGDLEFYNRKRKELLARYSSLIIFRWCDLYHTGAQRQKINCSEPWDTILLDKSGR